MKNLLNLETTIPNIESKLYFISIFLFISIIFQNCSFKAPPITFTQTQTASERQMIGEDKDIEKDGWLISSIKSSSSGSDQWERDISLDSKLDRDTQIQLKKLAYLSAELFEFKAKGFVGESFDGKVKRNPTLSADPNLDKRIRGLIDLVNDTRSKVVEASIIAEKKKNTQVIEEDFRKSLLNDYYLSVEPGEYFESSNGRWERKE
ncbi:DUF1318 domain-containing protein [Leptospira sp. GIMC2001]|uniref:DUF1318 domain-containing protein n=1 Tax=Leptospira sp. GIMC2001 TaxID=1513297 RepID=UPI00234BEF46|nr:DUF1318 domain-containing protein [Leptospira sp. GIMC2001]WCL50257.1 DUF1318 domain-containing protein [Leptospira sp. GIMC2001]